MEVDTTNKHKICNLCQCQSQYDLSNSNDSIQDIFLYAIDSSIATGDVNYIKNAIKDYGNLLDKSYIEWGNAIVIQLIQEQIEDMEIK